MHLLITAANDVTSDVLCERLAQSVLRLNWERWNEYGFEIGNYRFQLSDGFGRYVSESTIGNIIWRKPLPGVDPALAESWYCFEEFKYAVLGIIEMVRDKNPRKVPIDPNRNNLADKFKQLRVAKRYFPVPEWTFTCSPSKKTFAEKNWVVKSLTGKPIPGAEDFSKVIYTTSVNPSELCDKFPWFLQEQIEAKFDLTVVFVDGTQFAFTLDRDLFPGLDWRQSIGSEKVDNAWRKVELPQTVSRCLSSLMGDLGLRFGRIDLLTSDMENGKVWFLEVNPNGQWAWLDLKQDNGLFDSMVRFLTSE